MTIRSLRVLTADGMRPAAVVFRDGIISSVSDYSAAADADFGNSLILPGFIDAHAHINEPGRTEWEGFETAGRAAAAGGFTSLVDMPQRWCSVMALSHPYPTIAPLLTPTSAIR